MCIVYVCMYIYVYIYIYIYTLLYPLGIFYIENSLGFSIYMHIYSIIRRFWASHGVLGPAALRGKCRRGTSRVLGPLGEALQVLGAAGGHGAENHPEPTGDLMSNVIGMSISICICTYIYI